MPGIERDDARWFTTEVHAHDGQLKAWLRRTYPSVGTEVEDIAQESYLRVWKRQASRPIESAKAFLFRAAQHVAIDFLRRRKASPIDALCSFDHSSVIEGRPIAIDHLRDQERFDLLAEAVGSLPDRMREVILLHKIEGLSQREVAERLGIGERTVANHAFRGVKQLEAYFLHRGYRCFYQE